MNYMQKIIVDCVFDEIRHIHEEFSRDDVEQEVVNGKISIKPDQALGVFVTEGKLSVVVIDSLSTTFTMPCDAKIIPYHEFERYFHEQQNLLSELSFS